jgi:hypothetical protein
VKLAGLIFKVWLALLALLLPLSYYTIPFHEEFIHSLFFQPIDWLVESLGISSTFTYFVSDGIHLNLLVLLLFVVAIIISLVTSQGKHQKNITLIAQSMIIYFLAFTFIRYGFMKVFKQQFYLPEPNILATRFGHLDKDILFWSTMGTSRIYSIFMGMIELVSAALILIPRTRFLGLAMALGVFLNIVFINIGFDIGVKLLSSLLLMMTMVSLWPYLRTLKHGLQNKLPLDFQNTSLKINPWLKIALILFFVFEALWPTLLNGRMNDDQVKRPQLHGWYQAIDHSTNPIAIFIHRDLYFIQEQLDGSMESEQLAYIDTVKSVFHFAEQKTHYPPPLSYQLKNDTLVLKGKRFLRKDMKELNAIKDKWHWIVK